MSLTCQQFSLYKSRYFHTSIFCLVNVSKIRNKEKFKNINKMYIYVRYEKMLEVTLWQGTGGKLVDKKNETQFLPKKF